jgi:hypothetical protein
VIKLVCIRNVELGKDSRGKPRFKTLPLTIGKMYESVDVVITTNPVRMIDKKIVMIIADDGESRYYHLNNFVTIDVWREIQLRKLDL